MKRSAEIIHIVPEKKEAYLNKYLHPTEEILHILWDCGIRKQYYYEFGDEILRTYEYTGKKFAEDMAAIAANEATKDFFVEKRRKDVADDQLETTDWWAPIKWIGGLLLTEPASADDHASMHSSYGEYGYILDGITYGNDNEDEDEGEKFSYDDDDWSESVHM